MRIYPNITEGKPDLKLGETYLKFNLDYNSNNTVKIEAVLLEALRANLSEFANKEGLQFTIETDPGSIKSRLTWYGKNVLVGLGIYAGIFEGIDRVIAHNRWLSERIIDYIEVQSPQGDHIIRSERRVGLPGRLKRAIEALNATQNNLNNQGNAQTNKELNSVKQELVDILELLEYGDRQIVLNSLSPNTRNSLPQPSGDVDHLYRLYALKPEDIEIVVEPQ